MFKFQVTQVEAGFIVEVEDAGQWHKVSGPFETKREADNSRSNHATHAACMET